MLLHREQRRLPSLHVVARGAFAAVGALHELPVVCVFMTVYAFLEGKLFLKITTGMTLRAIDTGVFAQQRKLSLRVIEVLAYAVH